MPLTQPADVSWAEVLPSPDETELPWKEGAPLVASGEKRGPSRSAFERVTIAPPVPEREYVARMMRAVDLAAAAPATRTPPSPRDEVEGASMTRPTPLQGLAPLRLDLSETLPPTALPTLPAPAEPSGPAPAQPSDLAPAQLANPSLTFGAGDGDALDLVKLRAASVKPGPIAVATLRDIRDRVDVGDFSGALRIAELVLDRDPENGDAVVFAEHCRTKLKQMYIARLGGLRRTPRVNTTPEQLRWLALDHRAGFLLSLVDGRSTLDEVLDMSGMAELEALRLLIHLLQQNVLKVD